MSGPGEMMWTGTGTVYTGAWSRGHMHGQGTLVYGDRADCPGVRISGHFK